MTELGLAGRVAVVTGGTKGIGRGVALKLGRAGAQVCVMARSSAALSSMDKELKCVGAESLALPVHVDRRPEVRDGFDRVRSTFGPVAVLVTAAGIWSRAGVEELDDPTLDEMIAVHVKGTAFCMAEAVPDMRDAGWGKIVTVASGAAASGSDFAPHYATAKGGIVSLTKSAARQLGPLGIRVNCVNPAAQTDMLEQLIDAMGGEEKRARYLGRFAVGLPTVEQVAAAFAFLCSPESDAITGQVLNVDGGLVI